MPAMKHKPHVDRDGVASTSAVAAALGVTIPAVRYHLRKGLFKPWIQQGAFKRFILADVRAQILESPYASQRLKRAAAALPQSKTLLEFHSVTGSTVSVHELARRYYTTPSTIYAWVEAGYLTPLEGVHPARFDLKAADQSILATPRESKKP